MNLILLGAPGAGKGTQSKYLQEKLHLKQISTGDLVRKEIEENTPLGQEIKSLVEAGNFASDEIILKLATKALEEIKENFICDGFPRTLNQAQLLDAYFKTHNFKIDAVLNIKVEERILLKRLTGRLTCAKCGAIFNIYFSPPQIKDKCDVCGGDLKRRSDDYEEAVAQRLETYRLKTEPLIDFYREQGLLYDIDGMKESPEVLREILEKVQNAKLLKHA